jgi:hypothetical protein
MNGAWKSAPPIPCPMTATPSAATIRGSADPSRHPDRPSCDTL